MKNLYSDKKLEMQSRFLDLFLNIIFVSFLIFLSFASVWWCFPLVKNSSDFDLVMFSIGIGASIGILAATILYGLQAVALYGIGSLLGFYLFTGAYFSITIGGFSGVIGGILYAVVSIFLGPS
jgi:hypothetical protein